MGSLSARGLRGKSFHHKEHKGHEAMLHAAILVRAHSAQKKYSPVRR
jgi:hypothetical protein